MFDLNFVFITIQLTIFLNTRQLPSTNSLMLVTTEELRAAAGGEMALSRFAHGSLVKPGNVKMYSLMCSQSNIL